MDTTSRAVRTAAIGLMALAAACAHKDETTASGETAPRVNRTEQVRRGVADAATQPLYDIGLMRPDIPAPLLGLDYPYESQKLLSGCPQVLYEIGQLDTALGVESYQPGGRQSLASRGMGAAADGAVGLAQGTASDVVPFRSWVRRASGDAKAQRKAEHAIEMGQTRRAFLRGYGVALGCLGVVPAPPPPPENQPVDPRTPPPAARDVRSPR